MKTFFISDTHFNHVNIIKYSKRPFPSVEEMNEAMITNWNNVVSHVDRVIHVGDFAMGPKKLIPAFVERLNGYKILVKGDNDMTKKRMRTMAFQEVVDYWFEDKILAVHDPKEFTTKYKHLFKECEIAVYGHLHTWMFKDDYFPIRLINACVEHNNYTPFQII